MAVSETEAPSAIQPTAAEGFPQCWYAVALSADVPQGKVLGRDFLGGRVVVYRGEDGVARVMSAYCRHMGADLACGDVVGDRIRCEFHHWEYGPDGACRRIPVSEFIPDRARLFAFPVHEDFGLIWAFNGEAPLYDPPFCPTLVGKKVSYRAVETPALPIDPYIWLSNSQDFQHIALLHGAALKADIPDVQYSDYGLEFRNQVHDPTLGEVEQQFRLWGTNTMAMSNRGAYGEIVTFFTATSVAHSRCVGYIVTTVEDTGDAQKVEELLDFGEQFAQVIMEDDGPVLATIRFKPDTPIAADRALMRWLRYADEYPRANPALPYIT